MFHEESTSEIKVSLFSPNHKLIYHRIWHILLAEAMTLAHPTLKGRGFHADDHQQARTPWGHRQAVDLIPQPSLSSPLPFFSPIPSSLPTVYTAAVTMPPLRPWLH